MIQLIESLPALPRRPSALINLACDAEKIYNTPGYVINMAEWHRPGLHTNSGKCEVCFAGAVMAGTLGADPKITQCTPNSFGADAPALRALNHFRNGDVRGGLCELKAVERLAEHEIAKLEAADLYNTVEIPQPSARGKGVKFIRAMRKLAARLKAIGW